jgi:nitrogen regulatory protein P-II 1
MKLVVAVIKPFKVEEVTDALHRAGVTGITLSEVRGHGQQRGHTEIYRGAEYKSDYIPKARIEILVDDGQVDQIVAAILESARTGTIGDGKYWVIPIETIGRVRTGEIDQDAL